MKSVFITGASGAIGAAIAEEFAKNGYAVGIGYHKNEKAANKLADKISGEKFCFDVSDFSETEKAVGLFVGKYGGIDVAVNNAGVALPVKTILDTTEEEFDRVFDIDVKGVYNFSKAVIPHMLGKGGAIVNVSSVWGVVGASCEAVYSAAKAAVIGFTKSLAKEYAGANVRINAVAPGFIDTPMNDGICGKDRQETVAEIPLGRTGRAEEVAKAVFFLADKGTYITGETLNVNGGWFV